MWLGTEDGQAVVAQLLSIGIAHKLPDIELVIENINLLDFLRLVRLLQETGMTMQEAHDVHERRIQPTTTPTP